MTAAVSILKEPDGLRFCGGAVLYVVSGYSIGLAGLFHASWMVNLAATLMLAHAMTIAAYLIVTPYDNKPTQDGLYQHFWAIADAVERHWYLYTIDPADGWLYPTVGRIYQPALVAPFAVVARPMGESPALHSVRQEGNRGGRSNDRRGGNRRR